MLNEEEADELDKLYKELERLKRKRRHTKSDLDYASLLIDIREVQEKIWKLDNTLEDY